jgi:PleD family two-component response regulator
MTASLGLVEWQAGESIKEVLARADALMYQQKAEAHKPSDAKPMARIH